MQDRFRFRVWFTPDYQEPEMIYDAEQTYDNRCQNTGSYYHWYFGEILEDKDCIVMQCTGLKDCTGKLIYEGDIVEDAFIQEVVWDEENYRFYFTENKKESNLTDWGLFDTTGESRDHRAKIIGNIYENPELMEDNNGFNTRENN